MRIDRSSRLPPSKIWRAFGGFGYSSDAERVVVDPSIWPVSKFTRVHPGFVAKLDIVLEYLVRETAPFRAVRMSGGFW